MVLGVVVANRSGDYSTPSKPSAHAQRSKSTALSCLASSKGTGLSQQLMSAHIVSAHPRLSNLEDCHESARLSLRCVGRRCFCNDVDIDDAQGNRNAMTRRKWARN